MALPDIKAVLTASTEGFETAILRAVRASASATDQIKEHTEKINKSYERLKQIAEAAVAIFAVEKFKSLIEGSLEAAQKLDRLAQSTGIAVETLGGLGFAAKLADVDIDSAAAGFVKLDKSIAAAAAGNKEATGVYQALGISVIDASGKVKGADQILVEAADKFAGYEDGANKTALALALFGKRGAELIPLLNQGGAAIDQNRAYYERYSGVTAELTKKASEFEDTQKKIALLTGAFANQLTAELLPALQGIASRFLEAKEQGTAFKDVAHDIAEALKGVATVALYVIEFISKIGKDIGALAASAVAAKDLFASSAIAQGQFADSPDNTSQREKAAAALHAIWEGHNEDIEKTAKSYDALREAINKNDVARKQGSKFDDDYYRKAVKKEAPGIPTVKDAKAAIDPLKDYLDNINKEGLKLKFDNDNFDRFKGAAEGSKAALVAFDIEFGKFSDATRDEKGMPRLTQAQKDYAAKLADTVVKAGEALRATKALYEFDQGIKQLQLETSLIGENSYQRTIAIKLFELEKAGVKAGTAEYQKRVETLTAAIAAQQKANEAQQVKAFQFTGVQSHDEAAFQLSLIGKTKDEIQDLTAARQIDLNVIRQAYDETGKLQVSEDALAQLQAEAARQKAQLAVDNTAIRTSQRSALTGAKDFFNDYVATANDAATQVKGALTDAFQGAEDAFVQFVQTGKLDFKSLVSSIQADILRAGFKTLVSKGLGAVQGAVGSDSALGQIIGGVKGAAGSSGASAALGTTSANASLATFSTSVTAANAPLLALSTTTPVLDTAFAELVASAYLAATALDSVSAAAGGGSAVSAAGSVGSAASDYDALGTLAGFFAKGSAFSAGNVIPFAKGGGIVTAPTIFPMAGGQRGLMGEAGPEAIVPLRRGRDGSLGIASAGDSASGGDTHLHQQNNFYLQGAPNTATQAQIASKAGTAASRAIRSIR